jgi:type IV pilus assembly protein PilQ
MLTGAAEASDIAAPTPLHARVTLDFHAVDISRLIEVIGQASGLNMVVGSQVRGSVTVYLKDVPWPVALESILRSNGYGYVRQGNIIRIDTLDVLRKERERRLAQRGC